jgi:DNA-binding HxlR family transcriptional regulator
MEEKKNTPRSGDRCRSVMEGIDAVLADVPSEHAAAEGRRHLERMVLLLQRFGTARKDPVQSILAHVGNYWSSALLCTLQAGPMRPSALQKLLHALAPDRPISQRMLTLNLRALEEDGLIEREVRDERNPHVDYRLTRLGGELSDRLFSMIQWGADNYQHIVSARARYEPPKMLRPRRTRGWRTHPEA